MPTENVGQGRSDAQLRERAIDVLARNHRDGYTVPAGGLYPFQWCWDSGPIALGWAAAGRWDDAWTELTRLMSAQWPSGMVPHIVFWHEDKSYFPGPEVWATGRTPPSSGITQPPLPVSAAAVACLPVIPIVSGQFPPCGHCGRGSWPGSRGSSGPGKAPAAPA